MVEGSKTQLAANRERLEALTRANRPLVEERDAHETRKRAKEAEIEEKRVSDECPAFTLEADAVPLLRRQLKPHWMLAIKVKAMSGNTRTS